MKRKHPTVTQETQSPKRKAVAQKGHSEPWYLCPVDDCDVGYAQARLKGPLGNHYKNSHPERNEKEPWQTWRAKKVDFVKWLNGETKGKVSDQMKTKYLHLLYKPPVEGAPDGRPFGPAVRARGPVAPPLVIEDDLPNPPAKRRKLGDLFERQKDQLQNIMERELKEAKERADNAEAKLQRMRVERGAEMARDKARMEKLEERITTLETEIHDEMDFGSSTRLKNNYLHQAKTEAKLNPSRPEHGGFVY